MPTELSSNAKTAFLAIVNGEDIPLTGPAKGGAIGALIRKQLIVREGDGYIVTQGGHDWLAANVKPKKAPKAAAPKHNERTQVHVAAVRAALPGLDRSDDEIAKVVWRVATPERAVEKAREAFA